MPRARRHYHAAAGAAAATEPRGTVAVPAPGTAFATNLIRTQTADPAAALGLGGNSATAPGMGSISGLTPYVLGMYLGEFYQGIYRNIAPVWHVLQRRDDICAPVRRKRLAKVRRQLRNWQVQIVEGEENNRAAQDQAEFLRDLYENLRAEDATVPAIHGGVSMAAEFALQSLGMQFAFLAKNWERTAHGRLRLTLRYVPLWFFSQANGEFSFHPDTASTDGTTVAAEQWVIAAQTDAIMEPVSVAALLKRLPMHQLCRVLEKWGSPNVYGQTTAQPGSPEYLSLYNAVSAYISDMVAVISGDGKLVPVESRFQAANLHLPWIQRMDKIITINWQGGDLGTMSAPDSGKLAGGAQAEDTDDHIAGDLDWFSELCQEQIDRQAIELEFGPGVEVMAYFEVSKPDERDDTADRTTIETGVKLGAKIGKSYYNERFGIPDPKPDEELLENTNVAASLGAFGASNAAAGGCGCHRTPGSGGGSVPRCRIAATNTAAGRKMLALMRRRQKRLDKAVAKGMPAFRKAYAALFQPIIDRVKGLKDPAELSTIDRSWEPTEAARKEFGSIMASQLLAPAIEIGKEPVRPEIAKIRSKQGQARNTLRQRFEARVRNAIRAFRSLKPVTNVRPTAFNDMPDMSGTIPDLTLEQAEALGFSVAGITSDTVLAEIWQLIEDTANGDYTLDELAAKLEADYGIDSAHAATIAETNVQNLYNYTNWLELTDPDVVEAFPSWMFTAVMDDATTITCASLDGSTWPADDPVWNTITPPLHYNCRSSIMPIGADEDPGGYGGHWGSSLGSYPLGSINPGFGGGYA